MKIVEVSTLLSALCIVGSRQQASVEPKSPDPVVKNVGESVTFQCTISYQGNTAENSEFHWQKQQGMEPGCESLKRDPRKMDGSSGTGKKRISAAFDKDGRMSMTFSYNDATKVTQTSVTISSIRLEDTGNYICNVTDGRTTIDSISHTLTVLNPVSEVRLEGRKDGKDNTSALYTSVNRGATFRYSPSQPGLLRCIVDGGYPKPAVTVKANGGTQYTAFLQTVTKCEPDLYGNPNAASMAGLFRYHYYSTYTSTNFISKVSDNGKELLCRSVIGHRDATRALVKEARANLVIDGPPVINCSETQLCVRIPSDSYNINCNFVANPLATAVRWEAQDTNDVVKNDEAVQNYKAIVTATGNRNEFNARLEIQNVDKKDIQQYKLVASNANGDATSIVELRATGCDPGSVTGAATRHSSVSSSLLISLLFLTLTLCARR